MFKKILCQPTFLSISWERKKNNTKHKFQNQQEMEKYTLVFEQPQLCQNL
jgi:hypothetical protein